MTEKAKTHSRTERWVATGREGDVVTFRVVEVHRHQDIPLDDQKLTIHELAEMFAQGGLPNKEAEFARSHFTPLDRFTFFKTISGKGTFQIERLMLQ